MKVRLVSYSQPAEDFAILEDMQDLVAYCARVSNPANQLNLETSERLINYLIKHAHWSPLEMVSATVEIETTRDIARQILRHRSFSLQEFSQRYADPTKDLDFVTRETRFQDTKNRQNSIDIDINNTEHRALDRLWKEHQQDVLIAAKNAYTWAIQNGIAKEQARAVLPEGLTVSRLYMSGTLRSYIHYLQLRCANGTQKEHVEVARAVAEAISNIFPMTKDLI